MPNKFVYVYNHHLTKDRRLVTKIGLDGLKFAIIWFSLLYIQSFIKENLSLCNYLSIEQRGDI